MRALPSRLAEPGGDGDDLVDSDVPAAVVCARCGAADCSGCAFELTQSGVVSLVAWERPGSPLFQRLWATARATTFDADHFFESLPDGPIGPALRFAVLCEAIAAGAMAVAAFVPLAIAAPAFVARIASADGGGGACAVAAGVPLLAGLLVLAHAGHGWALDRGARGSGARGATRRALRFGLYAAGWDLVIGPVGAIVVAVKQGVGAAFSIGAIAIGLPARSALAFLRGTYGLRGNAARPAMRAGYAAAIVVTLLGAFAVISAIAWCILQGDR